MGCSCAKAAPPALVAEPPTKSSRPSFSDALVDEVSKQVKAKGVDSLERLFEKHDTNSSKTLERPELRNLLIELLGEEVAKADASLIDAIMKALDADDSHTVEKAELLRAWRTWFGAAMSPVRALVIIDVQNDFIDGTLPVAGGAEIVPVINRLRETMDFDVVAISQDWHPQEHCSFHESVVAGASPAPLHPSQDAAAVPGLRLFDRCVLTAPDGAAPMEQTLWPRHCVAGTRGAELHAALRAEADDVLVHKGTDGRIDSYSAFFDNAKFKETSLLGELRKRGVTHVYCCGIAYDVCVAFTALHAAEAGFVTYCIDDACRGVSAEGVASKKALLARSGVEVVDSTSLPGLWSKSSFEEALLAAHMVTEARRSVEEVATEAGHHG